MERRKYLGRYVRQIKSVSSCVLKEDRKGWESQGGDKYS